jgi:hypothetical protein
MLVARFYADHGTGVVRLDSVEAVAEAGEQVAYAEEGLDGGGGAFVVEEREDASFVVVAREEARRSQAVNLIAQIFLGRAQRDEAVVEGIGGAPEGAGVAVAYDEERAKLRVVVVVVVVVVVLLWSDMCWAYTCSFSVT